MTQQSRRSTSFGSMETWTFDGGEPVVEWLRFERNGRPHQHDRWEHVRVTQGHGVIAVGDQRFAVKTGDACSIPPHVDHWMETETGMEIVLIYGERLSE